MRKIGLIGGTGPESTVMYYKELNSRTDKRTGGKMMPDIAIDSVDFHRAWNSVTNADYKGLSDYLADKARSLKAGGSEVIALTAGTMHIVYDEVCAKSGVDLISIPKAVCEKAGKEGYKKVLLLGTIFTMENDYMKKDLRDSGIEVVVPDKDERELIARRIYEELESGIVREETLKEFLDIISAIRESRGIEAVILGCTELPLLLNPGNTPLPLLDSVDIHIDKLLELAMAE